MDNNKSSLEELFVNEDETTDDLLKNLLAPYLRLSKTEDKIFPQAEFSKLAQPARVLLYLLARRAMVKLKVPGATLEAESVKIAEGALIPPKSCGETLSRLKGSHLVDKGANGYFIPGHALLRIPAELGKN